MMLIANRFTESHTQQVVEDLAVSGRLKWVQLRDHEAGDESRINAATRLVDRIRSVSPDTMITLNSDLDLAHALGTGLHVGHRGPTPEEARSALGSDAVVGFSAHEPEECARYEEFVTYVTASPIFRSTSKLGVQGRGLDFLRSCAAATVTPILALGGVTADRIDACRDAGAYGIAVLGGVLESSQPARSYNDYVKRL